MRLAALLLVLLCAWAGEARARPRTVLLFVPEEPAVPAVADFARGFQRTVADGSPEPVLVDMEYLDMAWLQGGEDTSQRTLRDFYRVKYRERRPDVVVAAMDATPFVLSLRRALWPDVPCAAVFDETFSLGSWHEGPLCSGSRVDLDVAGSVHLALRVLPDTQHVALVLGSSARELEARAPLLREVRDAAPGRDIVDLTGLTLTELRQRVRTLPEHTVVLLVGFMRDAEGRRLITRDVLRQLHADGAPPLFTVHMTALGAGATGGMLLDYERMGQQMGQRVLRLLAGEPVSALSPGALEATRPAFDARELERWGIPEQRLPPDSEVRFRAPSFWERYRGQVTAVLGVGAAMVALIGVLLLERRRRQGAQRLTLAVLESLSDSVALIDARGTVVRARADSPLGRALVPGGDCLQALGELARTTCPEARDIASLLEQVLAQRARQGVVEFRGPSPGTWFELRVRRLELPEGGAVLSLVDVTARKKAEREAGQARDERAHLDRVAAVSALGVSIAHELNQPLAAILTNAETAQRMLGRGAPDVPLLNEVLADIIADDQRAAEVIHHLRGLLKKGEARALTHDLNALVREVALLVGNDAQLRGAELTLRLSEAPLPVRGDGVQLRQVVLNLTLNALDAVGAQPAGQRRVWLCTRAVDGRVELEVEDTGAGLTEETLARVFEPFFTTKSTGLGMGLSISRSLLEGHAGRLQAERRPGGGARFRCSLPRLSEDDGP